MTMSPRRPDGVAFAALVTRFTTTCSICPADASTGGGCPSSTRMSTPCASALGIHRSAEATRSERRTRVRFGSGFAKVARSFTIRATRWLPSVASSSASTIAHLAASGLPIQRSRIVESAEEAPRLVQRHAFARQIGGERVVDLVGDAGDERSHGREALRQRQFHLEALPFQVGHLSPRDVLDGSDEPNGLAARTPLQFPEAMNPEHLPAPLVHHPVLAVEPGTPGEQVG